MSQTTLNSTTTLAGAGHNNPPHTRDEIDATFDAAREDQKEAGKRKGSATQRAAVAIIFEYEYHIGNSAPGDTPLPSLDKYLTDDKAHDTLLKAFQNRFAPKPKVLTGKDQVKDSDHSDARDQHNSDKQLVKRGLEFAAGLVTRGIPVTNFDNETGNFTVQFPCLVDTAKGQRPLPDDALSTVPLNGKTYYVLQGTGVVSVRASVEQFNVVLGKKERPDRASNAKETFAEINAKFCAQIVGLVQEKGKPAVELTEARLDSVVNNFTAETWSAFKEAHAIADKIMKSKAGIARSKLSPKQAVSIKDVAARANAQAETDAKAKTQAAA